MKKLLSNLTIITMVAGATLIFSTTEAAAHNPSCGNHPNQNSSFIASSRLSATGEQVGNARLIMGVAAERRLPREAAEVAITASLQASSLRNSPGNTRGLFQQLPRYFPGVDTTSPRSSTNAFFDSLTGLPNWRSVSTARAAQLVQGAQSTTSFTSKVALAQALVDQWWGNSANPTSCPVDGETTAPRSSSSSSANQTNPSTSSNSSNPTSSSSTASTNTPRIISITGTNRVSVGGIVIDKSIGTNLQKLLVAARADGLNLTGSGYRDSSVQIRLRRQNCGTSDFAIYRMSPSRCTPPTAIPGRSMHERGLAIDFRNCSTRATRCYKWLNQNASKFGLKNLPSEPWHWSTNGF